jgi:hypothetical protein
VTESPQYEVVEVFSRPHPLEPLTLKEILDAARRHFCAHIRISPATLAAIKDMEVQREAEQAPYSSYRPPWHLNGLAALGTPVVYDEDVPDDEWRIAVWRIGGAP